MDLDEARSLVFTYSVATAKAKRMPDGSVAFEYGVEEGLRIKLPCGLTLDIPITADR